MIKIGREVSFLPQSDNNPRNGEGTFLRMKNGDILYVYSRYNGKSGDDHASADLAGILSSDEGETWSEPFIILKQDPSSANFMCPMLLRMENGDAGLVYLRKYYDFDSEVVLDTVYFVRSADEGKSWSEPVIVFDEKGYVVIENDHALRLKNGRIMVPINVHSYVENGRTCVTGVGKMTFAASDDDGFTWKRLCKDYSLPFEKYSRTGLQETTIHQEESGRIKALSRTDQLCHYECYSDDNGESWYDFHPNTFFSAPPSPLLLRKAGKYVLASFDPIPNYNTRDLSGTWGRTPLVLAVSEDDGKTFPRIYALEDDPKNGYCYPSIFEGEDYLLIGYYHSDNSGTCLAANKIIKIAMSEIES